MTMNPTPKLTTAEAVQKAVTRISYRHGEAVTLILGILIGFVLAKL